MATLYDYRGNPVIPGDLPEEHGAADIGTIRSPIRREMAGLLTPQALGSLMRQADMGQVEAMFILAEEIAERDGHQAACWQLRNLAIAELARQVVAASEEDGDEVELAAEIQDEIVDKPEFEELIAALATADNSGIACTEIIWRERGGKWMPVEYKTRPPRHFAFDKDTFEGPRLRTEENPTYGETLSPFKWIFRTPHVRPGLAFQRGLVRPLSGVYAAKRYSISDWMIFLDLYGRPTLYGTYQENQKDSMRKLLNALRDLASGSVGTIPEGMGINLLEPKSVSANGKIYLETAEYFDKQASKAILGGTMLTDDGSSMSQSEVHQDGLRSIVNATGRSIAASITRDLFVPYVALNYGERPRYPRLSLFSPDTEDANTYVDRAQKWIDLGGTIKLSEAHERAGFSQPGPDDELLEKQQSPAATANPAIGDDDDADGLDEGEEVTNENQQLALNTSTFGSDPQKDDVIDEVESSALQDDWIPILDPIVGETLRKLRGVNGFDEAKDLLSQLEKDTDGALSVDKMVRALARQTFRMRGIGDATDDTEI